MKVFDDLDLQSKYGIRNDIQLKICEGKLNEAKSLILQHSGVVSFDRTRDPEHHTSFLHFALNNHASLCFIQFLVESGANVNAIAYRFLPLDYGLEDISKDVCHFLLDCGAIGGDGKEVCVNARIKRKQLHDKNIALALGLKQQGIPKDLVNQICEEFWELRTK